MRILIAGASGFIGAPLSSHFTELGFSVHHLTRSSPKMPNQIQWLPHSHQLLEKFDAVIQLAGEPLTFGRWRKAKRQRIYESRVTFTEALAQALSQCNAPPKTFISASAVGYYGDRGKESLDEKSAPGAGFLSELCQQWESASYVLKQTSTRTVQTRFGVVLGPNGGALKRLIPLYRWGLGATLGTGEQWFNWIARKDLIRAITHILHTPSLEGPVNLVAPQPLRQKEFSHLLAQLLHRPAFLQIPAPLLRAILGNAASEMVLASAKVLPTKLLESGFEFLSLPLSTVLQDCLS